MSTVLTTTELRALKPADIKRAVAQCINEASAISSADRLRGLRREIKGFENRHKMTTQQMIGKVCSGELKEAGDIETWLIKYNLLCVHEQG
jgi:hypothetical protein